MVTPTTYRKSRNSYISIRENRLSLKNVLKRQKGTLKMRKESIHSEFITIVNIYALNLRVPKYIKQKQLKRRNK